MGVYRERWAASKAHRSFVQGVKTALQWIGGRVAGLGKKSVAYPQYGHAIGPKPAALAL